MAKVIHTLYPLSTDRKTTIAKIVQLKDGRKCLKIVKKKTVLLLSSAEWARLVYQGGTVNDKLRVEAGDSTVRNIFNSLFK